jgi:alpha-L-fucosidase
VLSLAEIVSYLTDAACRNGNLLLNVGPDADGIIPPVQAARLRELGDWLARYGESIYGTRGGPIEPLEDAEGTLYGATCRGNTVYLHVQRWPAAELTLPALPGRVVAARFLGGLSPTCARESMA